MVTLGGILWGLLGEIRVDVSGLGIIEYKDGVLQQLDAPAAGRVEQVAVSVGDRVAEGDLIATLQVGTNAEELAGAKRLLDDLQSEHQRRQEQVQQVIERRRETTQATIASLEEKASVLEERIADYGPYLAALEREMQQGLVLRQRVEGVRSDLNDARVNLATTRSDIQNARSQLDEFIATQQSSLDQLKNQIIEQQNKVDQLEALVSETSRLVAPRAGVIVALEARADDELAAGDPIAEIESETDSLLLYGYFRPGDGKRVTPGMSAQVSPGTVEPEIYGTIVGTVISVGEQPATEAELRNQISNETLVQSLLKGGAPIQVVIALSSDPKTASGLAWTSSVGPPYRVGAGTTAAAQVAVQEDPPLAYIIPIFGTWLGGSGG